MFNRIENELGNVISYAGLTPTDADFTQLRQAITGLINAATGGGDTSDYLLLSQAKSRLPIFPEIDSADGKINLSSPAAGTIRLPGGVDFVHRGVDVLTTSETDFATTISRTYHVRWSVSGGWEMFDLTDAGYNPSILDEDDAAFDSTFDDMLVARVVTNSSNVPTITNLINKHQLNVVELIEGADVQLQNGNGANYLIEHEFNWGRRPQNWSLSLLRWDDGGNPADFDLNFTAVDTSPRNVALNPIDTEVSLNRYRVGSIVMLDYSSAIEVQFSGGA